MKLRALDQFHLSSVKADSLRPGEVFEVSDAVGSELLARYPRVFEVAGVLVSAKAVEAPQNKAEPPVQNKGAEVLSARKKGEVNATL